MEEGEGARESASEEPKDHHQNWIQVTKELGDGTYNSKRSRTHKMKIHCLPVCQHVVFIMPV